MSKNYYIVGLILFIFFVISFLTNIIGPLVPEIIEDFDLSLTMVAFLPFAFFVAYGVMSIPSGILVEKYGEKKIMVWAFVISFFGAISLAWAEQRPPGPARGRARGSRDAVHPGAGPQ